MKEQKRKLSWFQKVILWYFVLLGFLSHLTPSLADGDLYGGIAEGLGTGSSLLLITYFFMWLYNKYINPKINVKNKNLKKSGMLYE